MGGFSKTAAAYVLKREEKIIEVNDEDETETSLLSVVYTKTIMDLSVGE